MMLNKSLPQWDNPSRFWLTHIMPALFFILLMLLLYPHTHLDTRITDLFYDAQLHRFTLKNDPFLTIWMHVRLKWLMVAIALASLVLALLGYRLGSLQQYRQSLLWVFTGMLVSTMAVSIFKHYSVHGCPWDIELYGGNLPLLDLFTVPPAGTEAGQCFPAGHPSAGFALMAFYFAFMHSKPRFSVRMLWIGLLMGLLMGLVQVLRGAHFLSHVLWSGWLVWMVLLALYWMWPVGRPASGSQGAPFALLMVALALTPACLKPELKQQPRHAGGVHKP